MCFTCKTYAVSLFNNPFPSGLGMCSSVQVLVTSQYLYYLVPRCELKFLGFLGLNSHRLRWLKHRDSLDFVVKMIVIYFVLSGFSSSVKSRTFLHLQLVYIRDLAILQGSLQGSWQKDSCFKIAALNMLFCFGFWFWVFVGFWR